MSEPTIVNIHLAIPKQLYDKLDYDGQVKILRENPKARWTISEKRRHVKLMLFAILNAYYSQGDQ